MASPSMTENAIGNIRASATLAAGGSATYEINNTTKFLMKCLAQCTFGTEAGSFGFQVQCADMFGGTGGTIAKNPEVNTIVTAAASAIGNASFDVGPGRVLVTLTNLDATNALTLVTLTDTTLDSVA